MATEAYRTTEIDLTSQFFEEHVEFLTKITIKKLEEGKFEVTYPRRFKSKEIFVKHFEYLLWFWFMTNMMEKTMKEHADEPIDYAR